MVMNFSVAELWRLQHYVKVHQYTEYVPLY